MKILSNLNLLHLVVFLVVLGFLSILSFLAAGPTEEEWLHSKAGWLKRIEITDEMIAAGRPWERSVTAMLSEEERAEMEPEEAAEWMYILSEAHGVIPVGEDSGMYVVTHSFHDNESSLPGHVLKQPALLVGKMLGRYPVSDATLAIDPNGRLYTCKGHICGSLHLYSDKEVKTVEDFLETRAYDGRPENTWQPYTP